MIAASCAGARAIDQAAVSEYGLAEADLVQKAGEGIARLLASFSGSPVALLSGAGNNAADTLCAAHALIRNGLRKPEEMTVILRSGKDADAIEQSSLSVTPFSQHASALAAIGAAVLVWDGPDGEASRRIRESGLILDGLTGTGLKGSARGATAEIISFVNSLREQGGGGTIVAIDMPSGLSDEASARDAILRAHATLAVEPVKACLYRPYARLFAGRIVPVGGIFPPDLLEKQAQVRIVQFAEAARSIPPVPFDAYKHRRGTVEIHAGSVGTIGAAKLAVRGAAAAGAGLLRVMADAETWPILAASEIGAMVRRPDSPRETNAAADAYLVGPGWGTGDERRTELRRLLEKDAAFVLDADALRLLATEKTPARLSGRAILTPHPGEFSILTGCPKTELENDPDPALLRAAAELDAVIILKSHVLRVAAPDGRLSYVDGVEPILAVGGSGDVLAGLAAGIAARTRKWAAETNTVFDPFPAAVAAAALLIEAGKRTRAESGFCDPSAFAAAAGRIACAEWIKELQP